MSTILQLLSQPFPEYIFHLYFYQKILEYQDFAELGYVFNWQWPEYLTAVSISLFHQRIEEILDQHDPKQPLFLYMAFQNVHNPIQAPDQYVDKFSFIHQKMRRVHAGMVAVLDEAVDNITKMFKKKGWVSYQFPWRFHTLILLWV